MVNWNRITLTGTQTQPDGLLYHMDTKQLMGGINLYAAREINPWFYIDLQGSLNIARNDHPEERGGDKFSKLYMAGAGGQLRFTPLLESRYVDPYLRVGINYLRKDFSSLYQGKFENDPTGESRWESSDTWNKSGRSSDKQSFVPISLGVGINSWFTSRIGIGLLGEYMLPVRKGLPHFVQFSARVIYRIGGKSKQPIPSIRYIEKPVERIVEKTVEVPVEVERKTEETKLLMDLLDNIHFEFDQSTLTPEAVNVVDMIAETLKKMPQAHYLITGQTDSRGDDAYNLHLSQARAKTVYEELISRGIPKETLKWRGIGKTNSIIPPSGENDTREGDRKITIEKITNLKYWNAISLNNEP